MPEVTRRRFLGGAAATAGGAAAALLPPNVQKALATPPRSTPSRQRDRMAASSIAIAAPCAIYGVIG